MLITLKHRDNKNFQDREPDMREFTFEFAGIEEFPFIIVLQSIVKPTVQDKGVNLHENVDRKYEASA